MEEPNEAKALSETRELLPESSALVVMLTLFGMVALVVGYIVLTSEFEADADFVVDLVAADRPGEKSEVLEVDPLAGLKEAKGDFAVPPLPFKDKNIDPESDTPCSECHDAAEDIAEVAQLAASYRAMKDATEIDPDSPLHSQEKFVLDHGTTDRYCFDCHNPFNRDTLRLANGQPVPFNESYRLCGQCHGPKLRDWRAGVHGKRTGYWDWKKRYLLCVHCHDPHTPKFKPIKPLPPPPRPAPMKTGEE
jgi:hypothetical protein